MTPARKLFRAQQLAEEAKLELIRQGLPGHSLANLAESVYQISAAINELPDVIVDHGSGRCADCEHHKVDRSNDLYGERTVLRVQAFCEVPNVKQCPIVIDAGFAEPPVVIPDYLKRQAE